MNFSRSLNRFPALRGLAIRLLAGFAVFALVAGGPVGAVAALAAEHPEKPVAVEKAKQRAENTPGKPSMGCPRKRR
jgi:hypothetical protein